MVEFGNLDGTDAKADGFEDLHALKAALHDLYPPEHREGRKLYLVRFTFDKDGKLGG